ncbi:MAG: D-glycero-beta-D-manno-heptose-7-phosphate kinase [Aminivibrio sp.]|jgi:D-beta-D-heptose 7-phosphate kinase/D-beta-D-heptose 1-phosphate adenosyltransferase|nr:D-glycero-beta-D-manno-heptose-7-phosphate kinase [Synergistaceae bacterium]
MLKSDSFNHLKFLVVGDVMLDRYLAGDVHRISPEAPVPVLSVRKKWEAPGGAANVAANLAALGCVVNLAGITGVDGEGEALEKLLSGAGIKPFFVKTDDRPTTVKTRIIGANQQIVRFDIESYEPVPAEVEEELWQNLNSLLGSVNGLLLSDYGKGALNGGLCQRLISSALERKLPVFVDPKGLDWERYRGATCVTPNEGEFFAVAGEAPDDPQIYTQNALELKACYGIKNLLVTRGARGMAFFPEEGEPRFIAAPSVREVYDVSGAGDTVAAVLAASVASGLSWGAAVILANRAAGIVITRSGTSPVTIGDLTGGDALDPKICSLEEALRRAGRWKEEGDTVVFTNGCFDLLHPGHIRVLRQAAREGTRLVVGLNSDRSVRRLKGQDRPVLAQGDRAAIIAALDCVDMVVIFDEDTPENLIRALAPSVLVKGGDYAPEEVVGGDFVIEKGGKVVIVPLLEGKSTTSIIQSLEKGGRDRA